MAYAPLTGATVSLATAHQVLRNIIASQEKARHHRPHPEAGARGGLCNLELMTYDL
jgi:hypothetical protein